jgi:hypothetical protein
MITVFLVQRKTLALNIRFLRAHLVFMSLVVERPWTLIPGKARPFEHRDDVINGPFDFPVLVGVFNSQDHGSFVDLCKQVIVKEGSQTTDVHQASWTGCITYPNFTLDLIR